jgi:hypothetical protein
MPEFRRFVASSELFSGFELYLDIEIHDTMDNIINAFYENLYNILSLHKFEVLLEKLKYCRFHIHDITMNDIINMDSEKIIYICDHC